MSDAQSDLPYLLTTSPPSRSQGRLAVCVLLVLVAALLVTAPFARVPLTNTEVLLPSYAGAVFVISLAVGAVFDSAFSSRSRPRDLTFTAIYSHFFAGDFIKATGPSDDIDFVELTLQFKY